MTQFRKAVSEDLEKIMTLIGNAQAAMAALGIDQWQDGYPDREVIENDIALGRLYVEDHIGAMAALVTGREPAYEALEGQWLNEGAYLTVHRMALDAAHRGDGHTANDVFAFAFDFAKAHQCASVRVDTHRGNVRMRKCLQKNCFVECGEVRYDSCTGDPIRVAYEKTV